MIAVRLAEYLGEEKLTNREIDISGETAVGNPNWEIGANFFVSEGTVKVHMENLGFAIARKRFPSPSRWGFIGSVPR